MKKDSFIGDTVKKAVAKIQKKESKSDMFMIYVIERKEIFKSFKKCFRKHHLHDENGKRIYYTTNSLYYYYAQNNALENDNFIIDSFIEKGQHSNFSFSGWVNDGTHNEYYLVVNKLAKGNKGKAQLIKCDKKIYQYKEGELSKRDKRFTL